MTKDLLQLLLALVLVSGCQSLRGPDYPLKPTARLKNVRIQDARLDYVSLFYELEVENPNTRPLPLLAMNTSMTHGGAIFLTGTAVEGVTIPPEGQESILLSDEVIYTRLLRTLDCEPDTQIPCQVRLWLQAGRAGREHREIATAWRGDLALPPLPEIEVEGRVYHAVDVIYVATPADVTEHMLALARVSADDRVFDLGCGDGRIVVAAAKKYGCRAVGYDIDPQRVAEARANAERNGVADLVRIEQKDIFTLDLGAADVITLYLTPALNRKLLPQLDKLRPGVRIVSHSWDMAGIEPDRVVRVRSREDGNEHTLYLWTTPLRKKEGR